MSWLGAVVRELGRIRYRLLAVNLFALLVPIAGLEFARIYERQLLDQLEQDMRNQAVLVRGALEADADWRDPAHLARYQDVLTRAARDTRTRIRLLDERGAEVADSHEDGPPEGPERPAPALVGTNQADPDDTRDFWLEARRRTALANRSEVTRALAGERGAQTRIGPDAVYLFVSEPVRSADGVSGVVYVIRSTRPVLVSLYRVRNGLLRVLAIAIGLSVLLTALLALTISHPLSQLSRAAKRIAAGERDVVIPVARSGEIRDLGRSIAAMTDRLDQRMRAMADFAADVAHEFKSPLTSIRGAAELLAGGAADDPEARDRFLNNIELDSQRLDRLVSRLLELGRVDAAQAVPTTFDLHGLVERSGARANSPDVAVQVSYRASAQLVRARESDVETALANLLDNALRHAPPGSTVELSVDDGSRPEELVLRVRDHGPGVPEALRERIFQRFFTTDEARDGTGLGLAIVRSVAQSHGGSVELETVEGDGACFVLRLPIAAL